MNSVEVVVQDGIALIKLNDPARRNALSRPVATSLIEAVDAAEADPSVRALVITGNGKAFCAGADLADLVAASEGDPSGLSLVYDSFGRVADCPLPTLAAVNGPAVGAGMNLALACDVRIVGASGTYQSRFIELGIHPGGGHAWMLERLVGPQTAASMLLLSSEVTAHQSVEVGLSWQTVPDEELLHTALRLAAAAASAPRSLLIQTKDTLRTTPQLPSRAAALGVETARQLQSLEQTLDASKLARGPRAVRNVRSE
ncbi:enoyl-CoA hydratase [Micromonospora sp. NPDC005113]